MGSNLDGTIALISTCINLNLSVSLQLSLSFQSNFDSGQRSGESLVLTLMDVSCNGQSRSELRKKESEERRWLLVGKDSRCRSGRGKGT